MQLTIKNDRTTINLIAEIQRLRIRREKCSDEYGRFALEETIEDLILILLEDCLGREADLSQDEDDAMMNELLIFLRDLE